MILEVAMLQIRQGQSAAFESAFCEAQKIIGAMPGYLGHELQRCIEDQDKYILLVRWQTLAYHEQGFRQSAQYSQWKQLLHHFYEPMPTVEHFASVFSSALPS